MLLAIDIGNSHTVVGLFAAEGLLYNWRIQTNHRATADEIAACLHGLFSMRGIHFTALTGMVIANVVPPLEESWLNFARQLSLTPLLVTNSLDLGIPICTAEPSEVGADRLVNAVAGFHKFNQALIIVDFGTATTFDCVSDQGEYLGGAIAPGLAISLEALGVRTARLPQVHLKPPTAAIGRDTVTAIQSGVMFGYSGLVEGLIKRLSTEFTGGPPLVLATGGIARLIAPLTPAIKHIEPLLTLEGLKLIHERCAS